MAVDLRRISATTRRNAETGGVDGEHTFIAGMNRWGKTYLAKAITRDKRYVLVHDPKGTYVNAERPFTRVAHVHELYGLDARKHPFVVYSPPRGEDRDPGEHEKLCDFVYQRGNCWFHIDEATNICTPTRAPDSLIDVAARGAERGICLVTLSQQPVGVYPLLMSQSHHLYTFYLANQAHRDKVAGFMPVDTDAIAALQRYQFLYWRNDLRGALGPYKLPPP